MSPKAVTARPVRNGRTSTSALRATMRRAEADQRHGEHVAGVAHDRRDRVGDRAADDTAVPPEVEKRSEEDPERDEGEAPELGAVRMGAAGLCPLPLPDPGGRLRA